MNNRQKLLQEKYLDNETAVIKRLKQVYGQSLTDIETNIKNLTFSIGQLQQVYDWDGTNDEERANITSQIRSKIYQKQYQEQLRSQVDGVLGQLQTKSYLTVSDYLDECYTDGFIGSIFDSHGQGVPIITPIDHQSMVRAVQLESKISQGLYTRLGKDVALLKKKITAQVSRSIATGMTFAQTAKQLAGYTNIGYNNAIRIARTEGHRVQTTATMDAMEQAKEKGADVVKQWDATLDAKTRSSHVRVDGEVREIDKPFSNGLMFPGDPNASAAEVVNCRCGLNQRARWALAGGFTKMNNFTGELENFESPEDYEEFKKAFFSKENRQYMDYVERMEDKYGTKDFAKVLDKMSDQEYDHYARLLRENPVLNKAGGLTKSDNGDIIDIRTVFDRKSHVYEMDRDLAAVNPNYSTGEWQWQNNCQRCVPTYEMRRRGYRVTAKPIPSKDDILYYDFTAAWENKNVILCRKGSGEEQIVKQMTAWGNGARVEVFVLWKTGGGHVFVAEQVDGKTIFYDPQTQSLDASKHFTTCLEGVTKFLRIDNNTPSKLILECCQNGGE